MSKQILTTISSMSFMVWGLQFRSLIHFEPIFLYDVTEYSHFFSFMCIYLHLWCFPGDIVEKNPSASAGDVCLISGSGWSPGVDSGNPLQYSCLENSMGGEAWRATVHGVRESQTLLSAWARTHAHIHMCMYLMCFWCYSKWNY